MQTVAEHWESFERDVMPADAPPIQRQEMRRAYYAGFLGALVSLRQMAVETDDDEGGLQDGAALIEQLHEECRRFAYAVAAGRG